MNKPMDNASAKVWEAIDSEKRRDRFIKKVSVAAWSVTFGFVLLLMVMVGIQVWEMTKGALAGALPWMSAIGVAMPLVIVLGLLSTLIATLATVGMFLRLRTASLSEIQLRLAALEEMIAARTDTPAR
jgi:hypothetical protein